MSARSIFALRVLSLLVLPMLFWGTLAYAERRPIEHVVQRVALASQHIETRILL